MNYMVFMRLDFNDGKKMTTSVYNYETHDEAVASFHTNLGSQMKKEDVARILIMLITKDGLNLMQELYERPVAKKEEPKIESEVETKTEGIA